MMIYLHHFSQTSPLTWGLSYPLEYLIARKSPKIAQVSLLKCCQQFFSSGTITHPDPPGVSASLRSPLCGGGVAYGAADSAELVSMVVTLFIHSKDPNQGEQPIKKYIWLEIKNMNPTTSNKRILNVLVAMMHIIQLFQAKGLICRDLESEIKNHLCKQNLHVLAQEPSKLIWNILNPWVAFKS